MTTSQRTSAMTSATTFPTTQRVKPLAALIAALRLIRDNQDTRQVARLEIALSGQSQRPVFERFAATETGAKIIAERRQLADTLDDHAALRALPAGSLGRAYLAFMEAEGLTAHGLIAATPDLTARLAQLPEPFALFADYTQRAAHDIYHILTGYGRDELGETCVLAFAYEHLKLRGYKLISLVGPFVIRQQLRRLGADPRGVFGAVREARNNGRRAAWLCELDVEASLPHDLAALRAQWRIAPPTAYHQMIARIRAQTPWRNGPFVPPATSPPPSDRSSAAD